MPRPRTPSGWRFAGASWRRESEASKATRIMATATATAGSKTRAQLAADYRAKQDAVKALETKGGADLENLTPQEMTDLGTLLDERDAIKAEIDAMPAPAAVKGRIAAGNAA